MVERKVSLPRKAVKLRKRVKHKKPEFLRSESWRYAKLSESWRRPRGLDHKMRRKFKGWPPTVSTGYKGPKIARGLHPSGYREIIVHNTEEVSKVDPNTQAARIAHTVGKKKRLQIIAEAKKKKVVVLNARIVKEVAEEISEEPEETEKKVEQKPKETKTEKPKRKRGGGKKAPKEATASAEVEAEKPKKTRKTTKTKEETEKQ
jgi:large subunit ribosomal protein L32e